MTTTAILTTQDLTFRYGSHSPALLDVNVAIRPGRTVLLGPNGAGKSSLLRVLAGADRYSGTLTLDGVPERTRARSRSLRYRRAVGWLPQEVRPFAAVSAREHVAYLGWLKGMTTAAAWQASATALARVGLGSHSGHRADRLSGGQTRRLGIASALVHDARVLLLDEPTAGLDPRERDRLLAILEPIERDHAVVMSTHDTADIITPSARILVLAQGRIRFAGTGSELVAGAADASPAEQVRRAYAHLVPED